ncbi:pectinesterase inhibitor 4-like [Rhodamnia argentea]|uniref:Pectinesterase inhibitor 4-like n=1 Tax=Rhodamnia argentea TaxID=178133 RepID=A0A8B8PDY3_9MYRT|nr:pectinesterase inhibitor 4-like [Rhodamnia argentea]
MEAKNLHFLAILLLLVTNMSAITCASSASSSSSDDTNSNFIKTSCSTTTYPKLCNQCLSSYASVVRSNPWKLCNSALSVSLQAARNASSLVAALSKQRNLTKAEAGIVKDCIENLGNTIDDLKQSIKVMAQIGGSSSTAKNNMEFQMANVKTWMSAAITDEDTCTDGFAGRKVSAGVKSKIRSSIVNLARITSNALSLIDHLKY